MITGDDALRLRCRRAAAMTWLAIATGDDRREAEASRLVFIMCFEHQLRPSQVFAAANDLVRADEADGADDWESTLIDELGRIDVILGPYTLPPLGSA